MSRVFLAQAGSLILLVLLAALLWKLRGGVTGGPRLTRMSWTLASSYFAIIAATATVHFVGAAWAYATGPGSPAWNTFLTWSGGGNHGRALVTGVFAIALIVLAVRPARVRHAEAWVPRLMLAGFCVGLLVGRLEGSVSSTPHYKNLSLLIAVNCMLLMVALVLAIAKDAMDLHLWFVLVVYTFEQSLATAWFVDLARNVLSGGAAWLLHATTFVAYGVMIAIVLRRLHLARAARPVATVFEHYHELTRS